MKVVVLFSEEDSDLASDKRWYVSGGKPYPKRTVKNDPAPPRQTKEFAHRLVLERVLCRKLVHGEESDHINGNTFDCRRENLRVVDHCGSMQNRTTKHDQFRGTTFHASSGKWQASVQVNRKNIYLGLFQSRKDAANAAREERRRRNFMCGNGDKP